VRGGHCPELVRVCARACERGGWAGGRGGRGGRACRTRSGGRSRRSRSQPAATAAAPAPSLPPPRGGRGGGAHGFRESQRAFQSASASISKRFCEHFQSASASISERVCEQAWRVPLSFRTLEKSVRQDSDPLSFRTLLRISVAPRRALRCAVPQRPLPRIRPCSARALVWRARRARRAAALRRSRCVR
jgi:hypothetical protein